MWPFKRQPKNRRLERIHVLDVKLKTSHVKATRTRVATVAAGLSFGALFMLFLLWRGGVWITNRLVFENDAFAVQRIDIRTTGVLAPDQIRRWAGVKNGLNLFALDLQRVKRDLELVPVIQAVAVERVLPQTLRLRVTEREPVARVLPPMSSGIDNETLYTLDSLGMVMLPVRPAQRSVPMTATNEFMLPILTGLNYLELRPGYAADAPQVKAALQLIAEFSRSPMAGLVDMRWIDLGAKDIMVVTTGTGAKITFGTERLDLQLRRWRAAYEYARQRGQAVAALDLSVANNVPFTPVDANTVAPVPPRPVKPIPVRATPNPKRKNV